MPLDRYPFSERYGWAQDKCGFSWQLIFTNPEGEERPLVIPPLLFTKELCGKAKEATDFYIEAFEGKRGALAHCPPGMEPDTEDYVMFTDFNLAGQWFAAMEGAREHDFMFNQAISLIVNCKDQEEIDYFWEKLSAHPESEQCGWLKYKYGVFWQIQPENMGALMNRTPEKTTPVMLKMKKLVIADLEKPGG